ncbi:hypothetical protein T05_7023 [Trichinella murrelli]|uniref:Uncharacterized protein n=1 Tax=Trichinella murrelli TaxID=144512 RepID=A0A0V0TBJ3_9BILA|nr:hypothetical protein T05_7023 [Trichinella murrelli]
MFTSVCSRCGITNIPMDCVIRKFDALKPMALSNCVSYGSDVFPCHARRIVHQMLKMKEFCIVQCTLFIHDSITLTSSEYDISSDGALS